MSCLRQAPKHKLRHYYKTVRRLIPDGYPNKNDILRTIRQNIENYFAESPNASFDDMVQEFGTPQDVAAAFLNELPDTEIAGSLCKKKRMIHAVCFIFAISIAVIVLLVYRIWYIRENAAVTIEDTVYIYEDTLVEE